MSGGRIVRDSAASTLGVLLQGGARFLVSVMVGRIAGPAALATLSGSLSLASTASLLWPTSAGQAASILLAREEAAGREHLVPAVQRRLARTTAVAVTVAAPVVAIVAAGFLGLGWVTAVWAAALTATFSAYNLVRGVQFGRGRVMKATLWEGISAVTTLSLLALVLLADLPGSLLLPLTVGYAAYAIGGWPRGSPPTAPLPVALRREIDSFVLWGALGTLASTGLLQLSMVIAVATESRDDAGMYAAAISLATPASMLAVAFSMALAPTMARSVGRSDPGVLATQTDTATRALVGGLVLAFGSIFVVAAPLVELVYGERYGPAVPLLRILLVAVLFASLPAAATNSITTAGPAGVRTAALMAVASMLLGLVAIAFLSSRLGVTGVAVGFLAGTLLRAALPLGHVWRRDRQRWSGLTLRTVAGVAALSGIAALEGIAPLLSVFLAVLLGVIWLAISWRDLRGRL